MQDINAPSIVCGKPCVRKPILSASTDKQPEMQWPGLQWLQSITTVYFHWSYLALELNTLTNVSAVALVDRPLIVLKMRSLTAQTRTQSTYSFTCLKEVMADEHGLSSNEKLQICFLFSTQYFWVTDILKENKAAALVNWVLKSTFPAWSRRAKTCCFMTKLQWAALGEGSWPALDTGLQW